MSKADFLEGDQVRIIDQIHGHEFAIGEQVELIEADDTGLFDWYASNDLQGWYVNEDEIEHIIIH